MKFNFDFSHPNVDNIDFYLSMPNCLFKVKLGTSTVPTYLTFHKTQENYCECFIHGPYAPLHQWADISQEEFDLVSYDNLLWKIKFPFESQRNYFTLEPI